MSLHALSPKETFKRRHECIKKRKYIRLYVKSYQIHHYKKWTVSLHCIYICMYWQTQSGYRFYLAGRPRAVGLACRWCPACCRAGRGRGWTSGHRSPQQGPSEQSHAPRLGHLEYLYSQTTKQQVSYLPQNRKSNIYHKTECPFISNNFSTLSTIF